MTDDVPGLRIWIELQSKNFGVLESNRRQLNGLAHLLLGGFRDSAAPLTEEDIPDFGFNYTRRNQSIFMSMHAFGDFPGLISRAGHLHSSATDDESPLCLSSGSIG